MHKAWKKGPKSLTANGSDNKDLITQKLNKRAEKEILETGKQNFPCSNTRMEHQFWLLLGNQHLSGVL